MDDRFERENFHSKLPKTWKIPNKSHTSLIKLNNKVENNVHTSENQKVSSYNISYDKIASLVFFLIKMSFMALSVYIILKIFLILRNDIRIRIDEEFSKLMHLIEDSRYKFMINKCDLVDVPGIKKECMQWKNNMNKTRNDIQVMGIAMDCIGHILDRFLDQISWKFFVTITCFVIIYLLFFKKK